jgi:hypothetical protein
MVPGDGKHKNEDDCVEGFVSWPKTGKHMSFDGRYLHAAPPDLMEPGAFQQQIQFEESKDPKQQRILKRRHRRVTFLVNIWLNYQPFDVKPFPESMVDKLSGRDETDRKSLVFDSSSEATRVRSVSTKLEKVVEDEGESYAPEKFTWPMGDCNSNELLEARMPLVSIRKEARHGGNIKIQWEEASERNDEGCFRLFKQPQNTPSDSSLVEAPTTTKRETDAEAENDTKRPRTES